MVKIDVKSIKYKTIKLNNGFSFVLKLPYYWGRGAHYVPLMKTLHAAFIIYLNYFYAGTLYEMTNEQRNTFGYCGDATSPTNSSVRLVKGKKKTYLRALP